MTAHTSLSVSSLKKRNATIIKRARFFSLAPPRALRLFLSVAAEGISVFQSVLFCPSRSSAPEQGPCLLFSRLSLLVCHSLSISCSLLPLPAGVFMYMPRASRASTSRGQNEYRVPREQMRVPPTLRSTHTTMHKHSAVTRTHVPAVRDAEIKQQQAIEMYSSQEETVCMRPFRLQEAVFHHLRQRAWPHSRVPTHIFCPCLCLS